MAFVIETPNAFEPLRSIKHRLDEPLTIREWVQRKHPSGEFPVPTVCFVNGEPVLRAEWNRPIADRDIVNFVAMPGYVAAIIALVVILIAVTIIMVLNRPRVPGEQPTSDPVFSVKGQQNDIRLGEPIEANYGRNRVYPSMAATPYYEYRGNDQFQFNLFCLGQGQYDISAIQIGDTDINTFEEVQYEVIPPGGTVTLIPTSVYTALEAGGQVLFGSNQAEYSGDGWVGPFPANPSGTIAYKVQVDMVLMKGLYRMTKSGRPDTWVVQFQVQIRKIDDAGAPLGDWEDLTGEPYIEIEGATTTPQRRTFIEDVDPARYEVRARRYNFAGNTADAPPVSNVGDELTWEALRSYIQGDQNFGDVTLLATIVKATNNLNQNTQRRFNVICTRKLPIRDSSSGDWSAPVATRSIVWAMVDIFRSQYGGRIFDDGFFDWDTLDQLDALYEERNEHFDWTFRDPITCWEAAQAVARVGRAVPLLSGSLITMKRDGPQDVPAAMFNQENIAERSFSMDIKLWDLDEYDSVRVEYTEPATGYKQETVLATLPGGTTDHPEDVRFAGIQDRTHAYHEGLYMLAVRRYLRRNVTFDTGMEGYIPTYGDLIALAHDVPRWSQGGYVVHAERTVGDAYQLWLSEPVTFAPDVEYQILLRGRQAQVIGPLSVEPTDDLQQVVVHSAADIDFLLGGENEPMLFLFGVTNNVAKYLKVVKIEPTGGEAIRITAVNDAPVIHSFDDLIPPALNSNTLAPIPPDLPEVAGLALTQIDTALHIVQAAWRAAFGAQYYVVWTSTDNVHWSEPVTTPRTSVQLQVFPGNLWVKVAAVNNGQGPSITEFMEVGYLPGITVVEEWEDLEWKVAWQEAIGATGYTVKVYDNSNSTPVLKRTVTQTNRDFTYTYANAISDLNEVRNMLVEVTPIFPPDDPAETIPPSGIELENAIPSPPTTFSLDILGDSSDGTTAAYRLHWMVPTEGDLIRVKVWLSPTSGFDATVESPLIDETISSPGYSGMPLSADVEIALDSSGMHAAHYWRVAIFDVWGNEIAGNLSPEQTIPFHA